MIPEDAKALLEAGSALIVGLTRDGRPYATRAYGLDVDDTTGRGVLIMDAVEAAASGLAPGDEPDAAIAITGVDVRTLRSVQVKGRLIAVEAAGPADHERKERYCDEFCPAIEETDGVPHDVAERWRPGEIVRCTVALDEVFLQTPGPGAGASLGTVAG